MRVCKKPCLQRNQYQAPSIDRITQSCAQHNCFVVVGMLELDGDRVFNACVLVGPQGPVGTYRKVHMPGLGIDWHATPGDRPYEVWQAGKLRIGMNICYDGGFPEASRIMTLQGADLIVLPTNWPPAAMPFAQHAINTRAMENTVYYMSVDRVGTERGFEFIGMSRVCSPAGETLASADHDREAIIYAEIDPAKARRKKLVRLAGKHEIDRINDRRPRDVHTAGRASAKSAVDHAISYS